MDFPAASYVLWHLGAEAFAEYVRSELKTNFNWVDEDEEGDDAEG